jgi:hypothetical protein
MNALNRIITSVFDVVLTPLELLGATSALILVSGVFGILALWVFKHISSQRAIKTAKDKIKGHMIAIRIYQDDLAIVGQSVGRVLARNFQYLGLNFGPFVPLAIPFVFVAAQFVVRYAYAPVPLTPPGQRVLAGGGTLLEIELARGERRLVSDLEVRLPAGLRALSPLVRAPAEGRAFQELMADAPGVHAIELVLPGRAPETKLFVAGTEAPRKMQPRRVSSRGGYKLHDPERWTALWPAEDAFPPDSPFESVAITYPYRELPWLPDGEAGILITFVVASMAFGFLALKPMGVQI